MDQDYASRPEERGVVVAQQFLQVIGGIGGHDGPAPVFHLAGSARVGHLEGCVRPQEGQVGINAIGQPFHPRADRADAFRGAGMDYGLETPGDLIDRGVLGQQAEGGTVALAGYHAIAIGIDLLRGLRGKHGGVQVGTVVHVAQMVFHGHFPVGMHQPALGRTHELDTAGEAVQEGLQVKPHIAQVILQRLDVFIEFIETAEDQPAPGLYPGYLFQAQLALVRLDFNLSLLGDGSTLKDQLW
jgi:hypothetical protein